MTDDQIELVARAICVNLGLDPDSTVGSGFGDDMTPAEWDEYVSGPGAGFIPDIMLFLPLWCKYRRNAALAIATQDALESSK